MTSRDALFRFGWLLLIVLGFSVLGPSSTIGQETPEFSESESESELEGEELEELDENLAELRDELRRLDDERSRLSKTIKLLEYERDLLSRMEVGRRRLESGQLSRKESQKLEAQQQALEEELDSVWGLRGTYEQRREVAERIAFMDEWEDQVFDERLVERLRKFSLDLKELESRQTRLLQARRQGNLNRETLEEQVVELEERLESELELAELVGEWLWAMEDGSEDEVEWHRKQIERRLKGDASVRKDPPEEIEVDSPSIDTSETSVARFNDADLHSDVIPLLRAHCFDCHGNDSASGDLNLEAMVAETPLVINRAKWVNVIEQSKNFVMPPVDGEQPSFEDREKLVLSLHHLVHGFDYSKISDPGYEMTRRLTHAEYDNTISDLFGVRIEVAARFPEELAGTSGFHNSANTLFFQSKLMERYMTAADEIVETLLPDRPKTNRQKAAYASVFVSEASSPTEESRVADSIIGRFARRAFRRPLTTAEQTELLRQYEDAKSHGDDHRTAIRSVIRRILVSPKFLLRFEKAPEGQGEYRVNDWELANRLSYFLWASMPDDLLFEAAASGALSEPEVLRGQIERMLRDKRSKSLGDQFAAQWLGSQHLGTRVRLDPIDNPWCTESLMQAMREETALFFHSL
ncbi:MAG: DUF1592 domain-containing protein, partial [Planctomycetota bacterium]